MEVRMNLSESILHVLRKESASVFKTLWKDDVKNVLVSIRRDFVEFYGSGHEFVRSLKKEGVKSTWKEARESLSETVDLIKVLPLRIRKGFQYFKDDFIEELENRPDPKEKTVFSLKVIGALTSYTLSGLYGVKKARTELRAPGLSQKKIFTKFLMAEIIFKVTQLFVLRFLEEVEKQELGNEDLKRISYFKNLLANPDAAEKEADLHQDEAIEIVDKLKYYILSGER